MCRKGKKAEEARYQCKKCGGTSKKKKKICKPRKIKD